MTNADKSKLEQLIKKHKVSDAELTAIIDGIREPQPIESTLKHHWGGRHDRFALLSCSHEGSKYDDPIALHDFYKRAKAFGATRAYHCGDITEGYNRRKGHGFECNLHGADEQVAGVVKDFPDVGIKTYFITGDHDGWHYESAGVDIGKQIAMQRKDMVYLGPRFRTVSLAPKTTIMLCHPAKGTSYALSYQIQKMIEAFSGGEKPSILAVGHYHKIEYLFYRNVHAFQVGCFQSQTPWMKTMNLSAHKGGWLIDVTTNKEGSIDKLTQTLIPYY
jgi:predicted phosphodiesterase